MNFLHFSKNDFLDFWYNQYFLTSSINCIEANKLCTYNFSFLAASF